MGSKKIVCLANSRKISGRCLAGKVIETNEWIRPVSNRDTEEISEEERRYKNGQMPQLLDIINIQIKEHKPKLFQNENYLIDDGFYWEKIDCYNEDMMNLLDTPNDLWGTQSSSYQGCNDRIPENIANNYSNSLYLIKPQSLNIIVREEGREFGTPKRKVRAEFTYNNTKYCFPITDPIVESNYLSGENGDFTLDIENIFLCLSIGLPYNNYCYKFVASIIKIK